MCVYVCACICLSVRGFLTAVYICVGSLVSVHDQKWAPVVEWELEKALRRDFFSSFLCHNHRDRETLNHILKRVVGSRQDLPPLIVTPFRDRAYNYQDYVCHSLAATFCIWRHLVSSHRCASPCRCPIPTTPPCYP